MALGGEGDVQASQAPKVCRGNCLGEADCISCQSHRCLHAGCESFYCAVKIQRVGSEDDSSTLDREGGTQWRTLWLRGARTMYH